jgi:hypothetical protein
MFGNWQSCRETRQIAGLLDQLKLHRLVAVDVRFCAAVGGETVLHRRPAPGGLCSRLRWDKLVLFGEIEVRHALAVRAQPRAIGLIGRKVFERDQGIFIRPAFTK